MVLYCPLGDARFAAVWRKKQSPPVGWFLCLGTGMGDRCLDLPHTAAMSTKKIRLGTMLTPLPVLHRGNWPARTATLDNLSGGRVILSVGLGSGGYWFYEFWPADRTKKSALNDWMKVWKF
jgi:hypothetical protein